MNWFMSRFTSSKYDDTVQESSKPTQSASKPKVCTSLNELMYQKLSTRSKKDQTLFNHSLKGLSSLCVVSALYMNTMIRRSLMVYEGITYTSVSISFLTCATNYLGQVGFVQMPVFEGNLNCTACVMIRGALVQVVTAGLIPGLLSFSMTAIIADKYKSAKIPDFNLPPTKEFKVFWRGIAAGIKKRASYMLLFQAVAGALVAYKELQITRELRASITTEERDELWKELYSGIDVNLR